MYDPSARPQTVILGGLWEVSERHLGGQGDLESQGESGRENGPKSLIFTTNIKKGTISLENGEPDMQKPL